MSLVCDICFKFKGLTLQEVHCGWIWVHRGSKGCGRVQTLYGIPQHFDGATLCRVSRIEYSPELEDEEKSSFKDMRAICISAFRCG